MILSFPILVFVWGIAMYNHYNNNIINPNKVKIDKPDKSLSEILNVF